MSRLIPGVVVLAVVVLTLGSTGRPEASFSPETDLQSMIFFAVLEGLYEDGVTNEAVDILLRREVKGQAGEQYMHFIYGCPICIPAQDALRVYRQRVPFSYKGSPDTLGKGLSDLQMEKLRSDSIKDRLDVLNGLIEKWVDRRLDLMRLKEEEQKAWTQALASGRKKGMELLRYFQERGEAGSYTGMKGCAVCDGANAACEME